MDDATCGADGEEEAYQLYRKCLMMVRKFVTNLPTLRRQIAADELKPTTSCSMSSIVEEDSTYTCNLLTGNVSGGRTFLE